MNKYVKPNAELVKFFATNIILASRPIEGGDEEIVTLPGGMGDGGDFNDGV